MTRSLLVVAMAVLAAALLAASVITDAPAAPVTALPAPAPAPVPVEAPRPPSPATSLPAIDFDDAFCGPLRRKTVMVERSTATDRRVQLFAGGRILGEHERSRHAPSMNELMLDEFRAGQDEARHVSWLRALRLQYPDDAVVAWHLVEADEQRVELDELVAALETVLAAFPLPELQRRKARVEVARDVRRGHAIVPERGLRIEYPREVTRNQATHIAMELDRVLEEAGRWVALPRRKTLTAVIYADRSELLAVTCAPTWSGGVYDGTLHLLASPTDVIGVDPRALRHEAMHAQLDHHDDDAPVWFREGLARAFEQGPPPRRTWQLMVQNRSWIPFSSLDGPLDDFGSDDASLAYAQSYAMVEYLRACGDAGAIKEALKLFKLKLKTPAVLARICGRDVEGADLLTFIEGRLSAP